MSGKKPISSVSVDTTILHKRLAGIPVGGLVTYGELSQLIGRDVTKDARHLLASARRIAIREDRAVFGVERGVGLKRLDDVGTVDQGAGGLAIARRVIRKHSRILACVKDFDAMPNESKVRHNAMLSVYGALYEATRPKSMKKLEDVVSEASSELAAKRTLALFAE